MSELKIVPTGGPGYGSELPYEEDRLLFGDWWYLHGELEEDMGYDKAWFLDIPKEHTVLQYVNKQPYIETNLNGIFDVEVEGASRPCVGFFWPRLYCNIIQQRGLVVYRDDIEAMEYATKRYTERSINL